MEGGDSPFSNGEVLTNGEEADMEVDGEEDREDGGNVETEDCGPVPIEKILAFGRDLQSLHTKLSSSHPGDQLKTLLQVKSWNMALRHPVYKNF